MSSGTPCTESALEKRLMSAFIQSGVFGKRAFQLPNHNSTRCKRCWRAVPIQ
jgi:hypothetical protein